MKKIFLFIFLLIFSNIKAQTTIKTMFYNLLNYPTAPPSNRNIILKEILNTYEPDIFMVCELESDIAANDILTTSFSEINKNYNKAQFVSNQSDTTPDSSLQQLVFYNSDYFILDNQQIITTNIRDINHYTFILKTPNYLSNPTFLEVFVTHLKSSQGTENQTKRLQMVTEFTNELDNLDPNSFVIFSGDFNFYTSSESGYQKIMDSNNNIIIKDVLNLNNTLQSWHNNFNWKHLHTQATRTSNSEFYGHGAYGGMDDRFDFIMLSENLLTNTDLHYVSNSYKNYGNNNNCYNLRIDDSNCTGTYSQVLRNNLYNMSDHLPVTLELESSQTLTIADTIIKGKLVRLPNGNIIKNDLHLQIKNTLLGKKLFIYNQLGQKIFKVNIDNNNLQINFSSFKKGIYLVKIEEINQTIKIIKN